MSGQNVDFYWPTSSHRKSRKGPTEAEKNMSVEGQNAGGSRGWNPYKTYNLTIKDQQIVAEKAKIRNVLKKEWQMKIANPYRGVGGVIVSDLALDYSLDTVQ